MLARVGGQAILVEDPNVDPVIAALAVPKLTCEVQIPKDRYDPFAIAAMVAAWNREAPGSSSTLMSSRSLAGLIL